MVSRPSSQMPTKSQLCRVSFLGTAASGLPCPLCSAPRVPSLAGFCIAVAQCLTGGVWWKAAQLAKWRKRRGSQRPCVVPMVTPPWPTQTHTKVCCTDGLGVSKPSVVDNKINHHTATEGNLRDVGERGPISPARRFCRRDSQPFLFCFASVCY